MSMTFTSSKVEQTIKKHSLACVAIKNEISNIELKLNDWEKIQGYAQADSIIECLKKDLETLQNSLRFLEENEF